MINCVLNISYIETCTHSIDLILKVVLSYNKSCAYIKISKLRQKQKT
jgi:hypothetical protein